MKAVELEMNEAGPNKNTAEVSSEDCNRLSPPPAAPGAFGGTHPAEHAGEFEALQVSRLRCFEMMLN